MWKAICAWAVAMWMGVGMAAVAAPAPVSGSVAAKSRGGGAVLASGDLVEIKVYQEPELDTSVRVGADGRVLVPLVGEVSVAGQTVAQAARQIAALLAARFLVDPHVTVSVVEPGRRLFTVLGQVQHPGTYRFPERQALDLMQVVGIAGGYTRLAAPGRIRVKRRVGGVETVYNLDGRRMAEDAACPRFQVEAGDVISVGERYF